MTGFKQFGVVIALVAISIIYEQFKASDPWGDNSRHYQLVKQHLLTERTEERRHLPIIWIHVPTEINARWWPSFGSRNTTCTNQPYLFLTIQSIIQRCSGDFNICLISDESFNRLLPNWTTKLSSIADPTRDAVRELAFARLLHLYGGMRVPASLLCIHSLKPMFEEGVTGCGMFVAEIPDDEGEGPFISQPGATPCLPSTAMMGCLSGNPAMGDYATFCERMVGDSFSAEAEFLGKRAEWLLRESEVRGIKRLRGELVGTRKACGAVLTIAELLGTNYVELDDNCLGIYVPANEILRRTAYQWFARMSATQVVESNTFIGKQSLLCQG